MNILVFAENQNGKFPKSALEAVSFAAAWAKSVGGSCTAITHGQIDASVLGNYGCNQVLHLASLATADGEQITALVIAAAEKSAANAIVLSHDTTGKSAAPRIAVRWNAGIVSGATAIPQGTTVKKNVFSGKAIAHVNITSEKQVVTVLPNACGVHATGASCAVEAFEVSVPAARVVVKEVKLESAEGIPLPEADKVVSAGRGMKGPENWGIIEELAKELGAATACSRPVSDIGWRPHHEHVGQTGIAIRPNLYIAVGISGAIQHLAGVNGSQVIVVINKDPEAPFFKAADYGIVGDAFEVVPQLIAAAKAFNATK
jgi:electron transfer flavoprotein alpha subunit